MTDSSKYFPAEQFIGYVLEVTPQYIKVHFPSSVLLKHFVYQGQVFNPGLVGNYVTIEGESLGFIGRIMELNLPEKERIELNEKSFQSEDFHPVGKVELLLAINYFRPNEVNKGLDSYPNIGSKVYSCSSDLMQTYVRNFGAVDGQGTGHFVDLGTLSNDRNTRITVSQQALFSRHCAIVGTTGGGKSWTVAKLIEALEGNGTKAILIDPTGEYKTLESCSTTRGISIGIQNSSFFHYSNLSIADIFTLLRPSGQVQQPKLIDAIRSLKIVESTKGIAPLGVLIKDGQLVKNGQLKSAVSAIYKKNIQSIESNFANFDILKLANQIEEECVYENDFKNPNIWGARADSHYSNCISLTLRANNLTSNLAFDSIFGFTKTKADPLELCNVINDFLVDPQLRILRIGFEKVSFDFQVRELLANSIGRFLLGQARTDKFKDNPIVLFVDEAHQFLKKNVHDEYFEQVELNSFDLIAKECRKYGLFLCLATQMPKDIPIGTLSQIGTFIVHRLINHFDKETILNACSSANRSVLSFLPMLGEGEAILLGVEFPMPISIKIDKPIITPNSNTPRFV